MSRREVPGPVAVATGGRLRSVGGPAVQRTFATAADSMAAFLGGTYGPRGSYKLVADGEYGDPVVTRDPIRALRAVDLFHPIERLAYGLAADQRAAHGDGAIAATLLCCALVSRCGDLIVDRGLHPRTVTAGLDAAKATADAAVADAAIDVEPDPTAAPLRSLARTQAARWFPDATDHFAALLVDTLAVLARNGRTTETGGIAVDLDDARVFAHEGGSRLDSRRFDGVLVEKEVLGDGPTRVEDATVATVDQQLYLETASGDDETGYGARVATPGDLDSLRAAEDAVHRRLTEPLLDAGVSVLVSRKGIDDRVSDALRREGVLVVRRAKPEDVLESVAAATGATVVNDVTDLSPADLGTASVVEERRFGPLAYTHVGSGPTGSAVTVLLRAGTWTAAEDAARSFETALAATASGLREPACVPGGGATEALVAGRLRDDARSAGDRTALVFEAVAAALDGVVRTLAHNCGLDATDALAAMRGQSAPAPRGVVVSGTERRVGDVVQAGVLDPLAGKRAALTGALESTAHAVGVDELFVER